MKAVKSIWCSVLVVIWVSQIQGVKYFSRHPYYPFIYVQTLRPAEVIIRPQNHNVGPSVYGPDLQSRSGSHTSHRSTQFERLHLHRPKLSDGSYHHRKACIR